MYHVKIQHHYMLIIFNILVRKYINLFVYIFPGMYNTSWKLRDHKSQATPEYRENYLRGLKTEATDPYGIIARRSQEVH